MPTLRFFRPRLVPLPTLPGALLLAALVALAALLAANGLPSFLAPNQPLGRGVLVVEGWVSRDALRLAAEEYRRGRYDTLVVSGGPVQDPAWSGGFRTYAERAADELRRLGIAESELAVVPAPATEQERTYLGAVSVRQWIASSGKAVAALDVFTQGPHARRSRALYRVALGNGIEVGVRSAPPRDYDLRGWWRSSAGARDVVGEGIAYLWTVCCFRPAARDLLENAPADEGNRRP